MATKQEKQLLECFVRMDDERKSALLEYAEFLAQQSPVIPPAEISQPKVIPRPEQETVVGAIKRLSDAYEMLDKQHMLHELSGLMAQHMLQGRPAAEVIDDIELVFAAQYQRLLETQVK